MASYAPFAPSVPTSFLCPLPRAPVLDRETNEQMNMERGYKTPRKQAGKEGKEIIE